MKKRSREDLSGYVTILEKSETSFRNCVGNPWLRKKEVALEALIQKVGLRERMEKLREWNDAPTRSMVGGNVSSVAGGVDGLYWMLVTNLISERKEVKEGKAREESEMNQVKVTAG